MSIHTRRRAPGAAALACALALPMLVALPGTVHAQVTSQLKVFKYINPNITMVETAIIAAKRR